MPTERTPPSPLVTFLPIIISTLVIVLSIIAGFWSLADPRSELAVIRSNYETLREHQEFVHRIDQELARLSKEVSHLQDGKADEADLTLTRNILQEQLKKTQQELVTHSEFSVLSKAKDDQITRLQKELDDLSARLILSDVKNSPPPTPSPPTIFEPRPHSSGNNK